MLLMTLCCVSMACALKATSDYFHFHPTMLRRVSVKCETKPKQNELKRNKKKVQVYMEMEETNRNEKK